MGPPIRITTDYYQLIGSFVVLDYITVHTFCRFNSVIPSRYLGSGMNQKDIARQFCVGRSTVCIIIGEVCCAIWETLSPVFMPRPNVEDWRRIAADFKNNWNFSL